jgi:hypothetical protein
MRISNIARTSVGRSSDETTSFSPTRPSDPLKDHLRRPSDLQRELRFDALAPDPAKPPRLRRVSDPQVDLLKNSAFFKPRRQASLNLEQREHVEPNTVDHSSEVSSVISLSAPPENVVLLPHDKRRSSESVRLSESIRMSESRPSGDRNSSDGPSSDRPSSDGSSSERSAVRVSVTLASERVELLSNKRRSSESASKLVGVRSGVRRSSESGFIPEPLSPPTPLTPSQNDNTLIP